MGFHRRIINSDITKSYIEKDKLEVLYSSESFIFMDETSSTIFELFKQGKSSQEIKKIIYEDNQGN